MTLAIMQGFETQRDLSDFILQGGSTPIIPAYRPAFGPSISALSGTALRPIGTTISQLYTAGIAGSASDRSVGYINTGITVNQAWTAGGITLGFGARYNGGVTASYGSGSATNCNQACFDGTKYWAIQLVGSTYSVASSPDMTNWTVTATQPTTLGSASSIFALGGGIIGVYGSTAASTSYTVYYTNNAGVSWSNYSLGTITSAVSDGVGIATGNSSFPHAVYSFAATGSLYVGTVGTSMTSVATFSAASQTTVARPKITSGLITFIAANSSSGTIFSATASNASLNTAAAWTTATFTTVTSPTDLTYNPTSNTWVISSSLGIHSFPNTGSAGNPVAPSGALTLTARYSTVGIQNVFWNGTQLVGVGLQGHIITSPDGLTWTEAGGHILPVGTASTDWRSAIYDGTQYVIFSDQTNGVVATTTDGVTNYQVKYVQEGAETAIGSPLTSVFPCGLIAATTAPSATTGQFSLSSGTENIFGYQVSANNSNTRVITLGYMTFNAGSAQTGGTLLTLPALSAVPGSYHYFELTYTKVAATANTFTLSISVDGVAYGTTTSLPIMPSTDTTSLFLISFQRNGAFTGFDDIYVTLNDGIAGTLQGPQGPVNIVAARPTTDVSDQWVKNGTAASNSLSVNQPAFSSQTANFVSSNNAGDKDVYGIPSNAIPAGYIVQAVSAEAVFTRTSTSAPSVDVGISSGGTESDSTPISLTTNNPTFVSKYFQTNPNGNVTWTVAAASAIEPVLNHTV
jgi:hypothetical protein